MGNFINTFLNIFFIILTSTIFAISVSFNFIVFAFIIQINIPFYLLSELPLFLALFTLIIYSDYQCKYYHY